MKILIVGTGSIGARHAQNAAALAQTAVTDRDGERGQRIARERGVPFFPTLEEALAWKPDGVVVATPHASHLEVARQAVAAGAHVLVEKPISDALAGVGEFLALADALQRRVHVVCNMRFHPAVATLHRHLPRIGQPLFARAQYGNHLPDMRPGADYRTLYAARRATGGGVILDAIHELDYLSLFFGPVTRVRCEADRLGDLDIDVEDFASMVLRHDGGFRSVVDLDYLRRPKRRGCEIVGNGGTLRWNSDGKNPEWCRVELFQPDTGWNILLDDPAMDGAVSYRILMEEFLLALRGAPNRLLTGFEAARELAITLAALRSAATLAPETPSWP